MATTRASTANAAVEVGDGTTPPSVGTPTPTVTHYQQVAAEFMSALDEISQIIPKLEAIHVSTANLVRSRLNVPNEFLEIVADNPGIDDSMAAYAETPGGKRKYLPYLMVNMLGFKGTPGT